MIFSPQKTTMPNRRDFLKLAGAAALDTVGLPEVLQDRLAAPAERGVLEVDERCQEAIGKFSIFL